MDKGKQIVVSEDYHNGGGKRHLDIYEKTRAFIDRSKVRILLWFKDVKSTQEVSTLLCNCSYKVISVRSACEVVDFLNAEGRHIDILLAEVQIPLEVNMKILKYIMLDKALQHIPVIMLLTQHEISVAVKCLRLGAADYLLKPLRTNDIKNLWTHMWRKRRMVGLPEKSIINYESIMVASNPSDIPSLFLDNTNDECRRTTIPGMRTSENYHEEHHPR